MTKRYKTKIIVDMPFLNECQHCYCPWRWRPGRVSHKDNYISSSAGFSTKILLWSRGSIKLQKRGRMFFFFPLVKCDRLVVSLWLSLAESLVKISRSPFRGSQAMYILGGIWELKILLLRKSVHCPCAKYKILLDSNWQDTVGVLTFIKIDT